MSDDTRLWVYALDRELTSDEQERVRGVLDAFLTEWQSHGTPVEGAYDIIEGRFVVLAGATADGVSGCSTDSSVRVIKQIEADMGVGAFDRTLVFFRDGAGKVVAVSRADFQDLVAQGHVTPDTIVFDNTVTTVGHVTPDTIVFDNTVTTVGDLRSGRFETRFDRSWHGRVFQRG
jgi:hypothetical protein